MSHTKQWTLHILMAHLVVSPGYISVFVSFSTEQKAHPQLLCALYAGGSPTAQAECPPHH